MADQYYTIEQAAETLGKTVDQIKEMVHEGKLREFRDGTNVRFSKSDVDDLASDQSDDLIGLAGDSSEESDFVIGLADSTEGLGIDDEIKLAPDVPDVADKTGGMSSLIELSEADTHGGTEGISILSDTDTEFGLTNDSLSETKAVESADNNDIGALDADINLDSFGSGSGLLDLSLQADDTSLGAVLDDILPSAGGDEVGGGAVEPDLALAAEPADMFGPDEEAEEAVAPIAAAAPAAPVEAAPAPAAAMAPAAYAPAAVEPGNGAFGVMMFLPLLAVIYAITIVVAGLKGVSPTILTSIQDYVWYVMGGLIAVSIITVVIGSAMASKPAGPKTAEVYQKKKKAKKKK